MAFGLLAAAAQMAAKPSVNTGTALGMIRSALMSSAAVARNEVPNSCPSQLSRAHNVAQQNRNSQKQLFIANCSANESRNGEPGNTAASLLSLSLTHQAEG
jgi:hypothetical protein